jgi:glucose-1-phosphate thymidylyltransferase
VQKGYVMIRDGKWDIPAYLGDGGGWGVHLAYLMVHLPYGTPYSLDQAYPFVRHARVLLGFPDVLFQPTDAFIRLLERQSTTGADVVLGLFPASQPHKMDLVDVDAAGRVRSILVKPSRSTLRHAWILAAWGPAFTEFLHAAVRQHSELPQERRAATDLYVGDVLGAAIQQGFSVDSVLFPDGYCIDIGTPEDLARVAPFETRQPLAEPVPAA